MVGARGGVGASSFAAALARAGLGSKDGGRRRRGDVVLVDLARGGGLDLLLGLEREEGPRWPDVGLDVGAGAVVGQLPAWSGVRVLSRDRRRPDPPPAVRAEVVSSLSGVVDLVVLDVAGDDGPIPGTQSGLAGADSVLAEADTVLVVAPCDVRSAAGVLAWRDRLAGVSRDVRLVVRGPAPGGLGVLELAHVADLPVAAAGRADRRLDSALEHGLGPPPRGPLARLAARVLAEL